MDKENLNGIPEEETEAVAEAPEEEAADESEEMIVENEATEADAEEPAEEAVEAEEESTEEYVIPEENLCPICGEREIAEDSKYCVECEAKMLKRKIPLTAWLAGLWALGFSVFAAVLVLLTSAPSLQIARGDSYARQKNWYAAYKEYSGAPDVAEEINSILGTESQYTKTGMGVTKKLINSIAHYSSPMDAYYAAQNVITETELSEVRFMDEYSRIYNEHYNSYMKMGDILDRAFEEDADANAIYAELDALKGTEGVTDIYVDFYKFAVANQLGVDAAEQVKILEELEAACVATGEDYGWLYYLPMAETLEAAGDNERALEYLDKIIAEDKSKYDAYELKMNIALAEGDNDTASKTLAEFKTYNEGFETAYLLEIRYLRCMGETEKAKNLCTEALVEYETVSEVNRQMALICLVEGNYSDAFDYMMTAYNNAYYYYYYTGDSSEMDSPKFYGTLYLAAKLLSTSDQMTDTQKESVDEALESFDEDVLPDSVKAIISGEKTIEDVLTKGECDIA